MGGWREEVRHKAMRGLGRCDGPARSAGAAAWRRRQEPVPTDQRRAVPCMRLAFMKTPNAPHEGRTAALSPGVPLDAVVRGGA